MSNAAVSNIEYFGMNIRFVPDILVVMTMRFFNYRFRLFQYKSPTGIRFSSIVSASSIGYFGMCISQVVSIGLSIEYQYEYRGCFVYFGMNIRFVPDILVGITMRFFNYRFNFIYFSTSLRYFSNNLRSVTAFFCTTSFVFF